MTIAEAIQDILKTLEVKKREFVEVTPITETEMNNVEGDVIKTQNVEFFKQEHRNSLSQFFQKN